mgnify:CR=1 FL=1
MIEAAIPTSRIGAPAMALVSQAAPRERHGRVIADLQVAMATGSFLGPYLGASVDAYRRELERTTPTP